MDDRGPVPFECSAHRPLPRPLTLLRPTPWRDRKGSGARGRRAVPLDLILCEWVLVGHLPKLLHFHVERENRGCLSAFQRTLLESSV